MSELDFSTRLVRFDAAPDDPHRPVATPIYQTALFEQESATAFGAYDYSRSGNPTRTVLERQLAALDGGARGLAFASGLAALSALCRCVRPGEEIVAGDDLYGGTYRLFSRILEPAGVIVRYVDATDAEEVRRAIGPRTRLVHVETPSNPLQRVVDLRAVSSAIDEAARTLGVERAIFCVDATATGPAVQRPLEHGADVVLHSATKYLCGHSDVSAGALVVKDAALGDRLAFVQNAEGAGLGPFDSFLLLRGLKTLSLRVERQQATAARVAAFLAAHPAVRRVHFVGLAGHPGALTHARQASGPGAVVSFETGDAEVSRRLVEGLALFPITVSFGGVGSSASLPCRMSHASIPASVRAARRLPEDLVRLSIGIEAADDLIADLSRGLSAAVGEKVESGVRVRARV